MTNVSNPGWDFKSRFHTTVRPAAIVMLCAVAALIGCKRQPAKPETVLRFAHSTTGGATKPVLDWACEEFGKQRSTPQLTVRVEQVTQQDEIYQKTGLAQLLQGGQPPDVFFEWAGWRVEEKARLGLAADLTAAVEKDGWKNDFLPKSWHQTIYGGKYYMIPSSLSLSTLYWFNAKHFKQAGVEPPKTWDEMLASFAKLRAAGITPVGIGNTDLWPLGNWGALIVSRWIGEEKYAAIMSLAPGSSFLDEDMVKAMELIARFHEMNLFNKGFMGVNAADAMQGFLQGRSACHPLGEWLISDAQKDAPPGFEYDCFNLPPIAGGKGEQTSIMALTTGHMVAAGTKNLDLAIEFLRWLSSAEVQKRLCQAGNFSAVEGINTSDAAGPQLKRVMDIYSNAGSAISPPDTGYNVQVANHFYDAIAATASGKLTAREALELCEKRVQPWREKK
ncbi:MAG TPA: extracellular solute-binding protein [Candidatus Brocadiia bacterium]|nr:extracellular solute-binding protein [Candidatus Brocadiia bacterium]